MGIADAGAVEHREHPVEPRAVRFGTFLRLNRGVICADLLRVQIEGMVKGRNRLVETSVQAEDNTQRLVQPVAGGIERDRLPHQCLRLPGIAVEQQRVDLVQPALGRLGIGGGGAAIGRRRFLDIALGLEQRGEAAMPLGHFGHQLDGPAIGRHRLFGQP